MDQSESNTETLLREDPEDRSIKPTRRRSSLFRKSLLAEPPSMNFSNVYENKLKIEDETWKSLYSSLKSEFCALRNGEIKAELDTNSSSLDFDNCLKDAEDYLQRANDFCEQMNVVQEVNKCIVNQKMQKQMELKEEIELIKRKMVTLFNKSL